jgi:hypothetical protein
MTITEADWLVCIEPERMLGRLQSMGCLESNRKVCLLVCACSQRVWAWLDDGDRRNLDAIAAYADDLIPDEPVDAPRITRAASCVPDLCVPLTHFRALAEWGKARGNKQVNRATIGRDEAAGQVALLRDIFGNPFRPSAELPPTVLNWNEKTVPRIADGIYNERAFGRLPILADALIDAGCEDEALIAHCRQPVAHVRGCWAIDLILGKQ